MENVLFEPYENDQQVFIIKKDEKKLAEMVVKISGEIMTVYHTEVNPEEEGKGLAKTLFNTMSAYAREQQLKVLPLCQFVLAQFKRQPEQYSDIWQKEKV